MRKTYRQNLHLLGRALSGRGYTLATRAMEFARVFHSGWRKDGVTPEFAHQVEIGLFLLDMGPLLVGAEHALAVTMLHDVTEDYDVSPQTLAAVFGAPVSESVWRLSKVYRGERTRSVSAYYRGLAEHPLDALVKGADRLHNLGAMENVFDEPKQRRYLAQVERHFMPMLSTARALSSTHAPGIAHVERRLSKMADYYRVKTHQARGPLEKPGVFSRARIEASLCL